MSVRQARFRPSRATAVIPDKLYFKIGEVAALVGVESHVLRYWQKEISVIRPGKSATNQRRYRRRDVELFREVRRLLCEEKYTLAGARKQLSQAPSLITAEVTEAAAAEVIPFPSELVQPKPALDAEKLGRVRAGLIELIRLAGEEP